MTTYLFVILAVYIPGWFLPIRPSALFLFLIFALTFILPALNFVLFKVNGTIRDFYMTDMRQRRLPFLMTSLMYAGIALMFYWKFPVPNAVKLFLLITVLMLVATTITFFYKISVHSMAQWAMVGIFLFLNKITNAGFLYPMAALILVAGVVMSARLYLNAHTLREVMLGGTLGLVIGCGGMILLFL